MSENNPFESPTGLNPALAAGEAPPIPLTAMVKQVKVVAVLMMVQGFLELLSAIFWGAMAVFIPQLATIDPNAAPFADPNQMRQAVITYIAICAGHLIIAVLHILAGFRNYRYRNRMLGIVALVSGLASLLGCWCSPTAIALAIYGLVVYFNEDVARVFRQQSMHAR